MAAPVLNSVSPSTGPPGTAIACAGTGFEVGARVGAPALVPTVRVSATEVTAAIPAELAGSGSMVISVYVENPGGLRSGSLPFTVIFPDRSLQCWCTIEGVCGEVPGFKRGGRITDSTIENWMRSMAQSIAAAMMRRGLSLDPADWPAAAAASGMPAAAGLLEMINRVGAAACLAAAIAADYTSGEWGLSKQLFARFDGERRALANGDYDHLFKAGAATVESGPSLEVGDTSESEAAFGKDQVF